MGVEKAAQFGPSGLSDWSNPIPMARSNVLPVPKTLPAIDVALEHGLNTVCQHRLITSLVNVTRQLPGLGPLVYISG